MLAARRISIAGAALAAALACVPRAVELVGRPCDARGRCAEGHVCHPLHDRCVPVIERGCPGQGGAVCWQEVVEGTPCEAPLAFLPCGDVDDCSLGCRTCIGGAWDACSQAQCADFCGPGELCSGGTCICGETTARGAPACTGDERCCGDACRPPEHSACVCGHPALTACDAGCVDVQTDPTNCGDCDVVCAEHLNLAPEGTHECIDGACSYACATGWADCDAGAPGCETDPSSDTAHCGDCGQDCGALPGVATTECIDGTCHAASCADGYDDCDGDPTNGCEPSDSGLGPSCPAPSCAAILAGGTSSGDGVYTLDPDGTGAFAALCDMTSDGGGWTLLMKATDGATFAYASPHWTTASVLNEQDLTLDDADAKYAAFNRLPITDLRAVWPELEDDDGHPVVWREPAVWGEPLTALAGFQTFVSLGLPQASANYSLHFSAQQDLQCPAGQEVGRYGINLTTDSLCAPCATCVRGGIGTCNAAVRWGFRFNENGCCNWGTDDAGGGIGYRNCGGTVSFSAGDWNTCCTTHEGINATTSVQVWGR